MLIRPAVAHDHAAFAELFALLETGDAVLSPERFATDLVPETVVAVEGDRVLGYCFAQQQASTCMIRHIAVSQHAQRRGVGRALLASVFAAAQARGATTTALNVKPDNVAAHALYRAFGMAHVHDSVSMYVPIPVSNAASPLRVAQPQAEDDAAIERTLGMMDGVLATARRMDGRVLLAARDDVGVVRGAAVLVPSFPGAYPFCCVDAPAALALLRACEPHLDASITRLKLFIENQEPIAQALLAMGGEVSLRIQHWRGNIHDAVG